MKVMTVVGARPNFMKAAPIVRAIRQYNDVARSNSQSFTIEHILVHTGQHSDTMMSEVFLADLELPAPDVRLSIGAGSQAVQTAEVLSKFEPLVMQERPDVVIVVGDVTSTVACALVTAKTALDASGRRPLLAHVEAGLRSFDRTMPEEINRVVTDHISDVLFATEKSGVYNLGKEGVPAEKIYFVGNTMIDSVLASREKADASTILQKLGLRTGESSISSYGVLTLHRPANVDDESKFVNIVNGLAELAEKYPIIFPVHPRTQPRIRSVESANRVRFRHCSNNGQEVSHPAQPGIVLIEPLGYLDFLCLMKHARLVITDSGGIQEETTCLGVPCVTVRENTERPVTIESGTNVLAGVSREGIAAAIRGQLSGGVVAGTPEMWDGQAATRIVNAIVAMRCQQ